MNKPEKTLRQIHDEDEWEGAIHLAMEWHAERLRQLEIEHKRNLRRLDRWTTVMYLVVILIVLAYGAAMYYAILKHAGTQ